MKKLTIYLENDKDIERFESYARFIADDLDNGIAAQQERRPVRWKLETITKTEST